MTLRPTPLHTFGSNVQNAMVYSFKNKLNYCLVKHKATEDWRKVQGGCAKNKEETNKPPPPSGQRIRHAHFQT